MTCNISRLPLRISLRNLITSGPKHSGNWAFTKTYVCNRCLPKRPLELDVRREPLAAAKWKSSHARGIKSSILYQTATKPTLASKRHVAGETGTTARARAGYFPDTSHRAVGYFLIGSAISVFGIVVFGGLTRLTESGLSITEWRPITGSIPPLSATDWETEFAKYRSSPEYEVLNPQMDLADFQRIFWMEWIHRQWGRVIGVSFLLPSIYFVARGRACARTAATLAGITGLIGFQGFIGWWMVKSGLRDDLFAAGSHPRVSQYRLAAHLGTAFACYSSMLLAGLAVLRDSRPFDAAAASQPPRPLSLRLLRRSVAGLAALVFATAVSGALVAGLDAGLIYNEFPYMGTGFTPPVAELFDPAYSHVPDRSDLIWRNMLENPSLVQLDHRVMAVTTFSAVVALWSYTRFNPPMRILLAPAVRRAISAVMAVASLQVTLGLTTLLYLIPTPVAAAHQAGSLALLTSLLVLWTRLGSPRRAATLLRQGKTFIGFTHTFPSKSTLPQAPAKWGMTRT